MATADSIRTLADDVRKMVYEYITPEGECLFDPIKIEMALEFVKLEIEKSIRKENGESN
jgi:hypothetical protein